jgi:hypothetical protein
MVHKRKPLEFSDPYDESIPGGAGGSAWAAVDRNLPKRRQSVEKEWEDFFKVVANEGKCPACGSISQDYLVSDECPECGHRG